MAFKTPGNKIERNFFFATYSSVLAWNGLSKLTNSVGFPEVWGGGETALNAAFLLTDLEKFKFSF